MLIRVVTIGGEKFKTRGQLIEKKIDLLESLAGKVLCVDLIKFLDFVSLELYLRLSLVSFFLLKTSRPSVSLCLP